MSSLANSPANAVSARLVKRFPAGPGSEAFTLDVDLETPAGVTVLLGPSGAGKSLALNCIAGFVRPDEGRILIHNELFFDATTRVSVPPERRRCGYVFQDHALFPHMTVRENLRFAASVAPTDANRGLHLHRRINELLEIFELTELAARKPVQLSGGQKQRAAVARILMSEPRLLLLDEPTRGLDARLREAFYDVLRKTRERLDVPVILVTHDLEECFELAGFVCLMDRGRFLQAGPRDQVFAKPATAGIARSLGVYNVVPAVVAALDPSRDTSKIRLGEGQGNGEEGHIEASHIEIDGPYLPGHLIGDHGFLCVRASEIKVLPESPRASNRELLLHLLSSAPSSRGVRLNLQHGMFVVVSETEFQILRRAPRVQVHIPRTAVCFLGK